jgi:hypothetical protein
VLGGRAPSGLGSNGQLKSGGGVVGASGDPLLRGSKLRETKVALCRMFHAHVVEPDVQGESMLDSEGSGGSA